MKRPSLTKALPFVLTLTFALSHISKAQVGGWNPELVAESREALDEMIEDAPKLIPFHKQSHSYVVFPRITKAGIGIGGAAGKGTVFLNHTAIGTSKMKQASIGLQLGGQQYAEVIFFENKEAFDRFKNGKLKFDAQASAVAITAGASIDAAYQDGVAVFTRVKGGLMYEASIGGQHFTFKPLPAEGQ